jgi:hypothetical protein
VVAHSPMRASSRSRTGLWLASAGMTPPSGPLVISWLRLPRRFKLIARLPDPARISWTTIDSGSPHDPRYRSARILALVPRQQPNADGASSEAHGARAACRGRAANWIAAPRTPSGRIRKYAVMPCVHALAVAPVRTDRRKREPSGLRCTTSRDLTDCRAFRATIRHTDS